MMYQFMDAWTNVYYSNGLQKGLTNKTNFVIVGPDFKDSLPDVPDGIVVHATLNQSWLIVRTQVEGLHDLPNVHAVQDQHGLAPLSMFGKPYVAPAGVVNPDIPSAPGPSPQANALNGQQFFAKAAEWFNKVPFPDADKAAGIEKVLAQIGIRYGQPYVSLSAEQKKAMDVATEGVQGEFAKIAANQAAIGDVKGGWVIPNQKIGRYGTDFVLRAAISFVGFGANLAADGFYPLSFRTAPGMFWTAGRNTRLLSPSVATAAKVSHSAG